MQGVLLSSWAEEQWCGCLEVLSCRLRSFSADHTSLDHSVLDFLPYHMNPDLEVYLQEVYVRNHTSDIHFATPNVVKTDSGTPHQNVSFFLTHLDGSLLALASAPSVKTYSDPSGVGEAPFPS